MAAAVGVGSAPEVAARPLDELIGLLERVARHHQDSGDPRLTTLTAGDIEVDLSARRATCAGRPVPLSLVEFNLLLALVWRRGCVVSRRDLWRDVWGTDDPHIDGSLRTHLYRLRKKLGDDPVRPHRIHTIHRVGYRLDP